MPSQSVPNHPSRLCFSLQSAPAKHRRPMKAFISNFVCEFGITFMAEGRLDNKNISICVLKKCYLQFHLHWAVPCFEGCTGIPCLANKPR
jgi:hypothetical protein